MVCTFYLEIERGTKGSKTVKTTGRKIIHRLCSMFNLFYVGFLRTFPRFPRASDAGRVRVDFDSISHFSRVSFDVMSKKPEQARNVPPKSTSNELCRPTGQRRDGMTPFRLRGKRWGGEWTTRLVGRRFLSVFPLNTIR